MDNLKNLVTSCIPIWVRRIFDCMRALSNKSVSLPGYTCIFIHTQNSYWRLEHITTTDIISTTDSKIFKRAVIIHLLSNLKLWRNKSDRTLSKTVQERNRFTPGSDKNTIEVALMWSQIRHNWFISWWVTCIPLTLLRTNIHENVEMIRLQREVKEKSTKLTALQAKYANLEEASIHSFDSSNCGLPWENVDFCRREENITNF